jgi:hypothetical protein
VYRTMRESAEREEKVSKVNKGARTLSLLPLSVRAIWWAHVRQCVGWEGRN